MPASIQAGFGPASDRLRTCRLRSGRATARAEPSQYEPARHEAPSNPGSASFGHFPGSGPSSSIAAARPSDGRTTRRRTDSAEGRDDTSVGRNVSRAREDQGAVGGRSRAGSRPETTIQPRVGPRSAPTGSRPCRTEFVPHCPEPRSPPLRADRGPPAEHRRTTMRRGDEAGHRRPERPEIVGRLWTRCRRPDARRAWAIARRCEPAGRLRKKFARFRTASNRRSWWPQPRSGGPIRIPARASEGAGADFSRRRCARVAAAASRAHGPVPRAHEAVPRAPAPASRAPKAVSRASMTASRAPNAASRAPRAASCAADAASRASTIGSRARCPVRAAAAVVTVARTVTVETSAVPIHAARTFLSRGPVPRLFRRAGCALDARRTSDGPATDQRRTSERRRAPGRRTHSFLL